MQMATVSIHLLPNDSLGSLLVLEAPFEHSQQLAGLHHHIILPMEDHLQLQIDDMLFS